MSDIKVVPEVYHKEDDLGIKVVVAATEHGEEGLDEAKRHIEEESEFTEVEYKRLRRKIDM